MVLAGRARTQHITKMDLNLYTVLIDGGNFFEGDAYERAIDAKGHGRVAGR